jgi:hypothetical protein
MLGLLTSFRLLFCRLQHEALAAEGAAAGLLQALLSCASSHKSAAAVAAAAACLQALCEAAPDCRAKLGGLPGGRHSGVACAASADGVAVSAVAASVISDFEL